MSRQTAIDLAYLVAAITFVLALKGLSSPKRARQGTIVGAVGMAVAVGATFFHQENGHGLRNLGLMIGAMVLGLVVAVPMARFMKMTSMPQLIAIFNGVGGGAAALVSITEFLHLDVKNVPTYVVLEVVLGVLIGAMSFSGSAIAYAKLQELMTGRPITYPGQQILNGIIFFGALGIVVALLISPTNLLLWVLLVVSLIVGISFVLPIGGADVPVLIS
ncbi:MAG: NAD(P)(+) transhydrogenase (Re/Si-specific) subunit beta, partial [Actinomycetota bacterium]